MSPERAAITAMSGLATKAWVLGLPSARLAKLRLKLWTMVFSSFLSAPARSQRPMQGPQAFVMTVAPNFSNRAISPSRSAVARTCSEPGLISSGHLGESPLSSACLTIEAAM